MPISIKPPVACRPRNPATESLASEIRVMCAGVMRANGWDLARLCVEINLSETQLRAARLGKCDPRASSFRKLLNLYLATDERKTGTK